MIVDDDEADFAAVSLAVKNSSSQVMFVDDDDTDSATISLAIKNSSSHVTYKLRCWDILWRTLMETGAD